MASKINNALIYFFMMIVNGEGGGWLAASAPCHIVFCLKGSFSVKFDKTVNLTMAPMMFQNYVRLYKRIETIKTRRHSLLATGRRKLTRTTMSV